MERISHLNGINLRRCKKPCRPSGHYHCPCCSRTVIRRVDIEKHLASCRLQHLPSVPPPASTTHAPPGAPLLASAALCPPLPLALVTLCLPGAPPPQPVAHCLTPPGPAAHGLTAPTSAAHVHATSQDHTYARPSVPDAAEVCGKSVTCPHCNISMLKKNMNAHMLRKHAGVSCDITQACHLPCIFVDETNGVYAVRRTGHGFSVPVHVQRKTWGKVHMVKCELDECSEYQMLPRRSGSSHSLCAHLRSVDYCGETGTETFLREDVLEEMIGLKFFGEANAAACLRRQKAACEAHVPLCVPVNFGGSSSQICFSVHEPNTDSFFRLGRIMVTFNISKKTWHCLCAKPRTSCPHIDISKWHLFQTDREQFKSETFASLTSTSECSSQQDITAVKRTVQYILKEKKYPQPLPKEVTISNTNLDHFFPLENECQLCVEHPPLEDAVRITNKAQIVGMMGLLHNISTYQRQCPQCKMIYRYQEWKDGLHNFNDHLLLSLELCLFLRENVCNHVSMSRVVDSLEGLRGEKFPSRDTIFHAYCHFEALTDTEHTYSCVNCGFYPPVAIMDLHRKGVFKLAVSDQKAPPENSSDEQEIERFWESVHLKMINRGFFQSNAKNPFAVEPSYEHWAPWIGSETRKSDCVFNTDFKQVKPCTSTAEAELSSVTEDRLIDEHPQHAQHVVP